MFMMINVILKMTQGEMKTYICNNWFVINRHFEIGSYDVGWFRSNLFSKSNRITTMEQFKGSRGRKMSLFYYSLS